MIRRTRTSLLMAIALGLIVFPANIARAQMAEDEPSAATTLEQRIEKRKIAQSLRLSEADAQRFRARCQASQGYLARLSDRLLGINVRRERAYDALLTRLTKLGDKLTAAEVDTTTYDNQVSELQNKIEAFYAALDKFQVTVGDLATMDCVADPEGYKTSLEEARSLRLQTVEAAQAISTYLKDTLKPTLIEARKALADHTEE